MARYTAHLGFSASHVAFSHKVFHCSKVFTLQPPISVRPGHTCVTYLPTLHVVALHRATGLLPILRLSPSHLSCSLQGSLLLLRASCLCLCVCLLLVRPPRAVGILHSPSPPPLSRLQSLSSQLDLLALGCDVLGARPRDDLSYPARSGQHQRRATTPEPEVPLRRGRLPPHPWLLGFV
ncbi:hypothetical protein LY78DRAFT_200992 [Colletotrichum sublineola]|nr:hypothetical protein LY78DRAFT_200992 [Colletotrichum sublineola]